VFSTSFGHRLQFDRRGNFWFSVKNSKSQNNKFQATSTKIQNVKPVWVIGYLPREKIKKTKNETE
jgi:hypothetical protein